MARIALRLRLAALALALALGFAPAAGLAETTLRFIPQADLRSIDPIWTTAYVSRNFGYLVFDTPFPLLISALGKLSSNVPFMMPERIAKTDAFQQIPEAIGSGPFKFLKEEWVPGSKAVFVKNKDYVPREEPPSLAAGGKVAKVDRVEWLYIPDVATATAALNAGEADWYENPPTDVLKVFAANPDVTVATTDPLGNMGVLRFNHRPPPFDNV